MSEPVPFDPSEPAPITRPVLPRRDMPANEEAEQHVLACCLLEDDNGRTLKRARDAGLSADSFYWPANVTLFKNLLRLQAEGKPLILEILAGELSAEDMGIVGGFPYLMQVTAKVPTSAHVGYMIEKVRECEQKRALIRSATELVEHAYNGTSLPELATHAEWTLRPLIKGASKTDRDGRMLAELLTLRVSAAEAPAEPITRLFLVGKPVGTPGNLTTITSKSKMGKTAATGATVAAVIVASLDIQGQDTFGFTAPTNAGHAVIVIDTEQSKYDAYVCYRRVLERAGVEKDPPWLMHFSLVSKSPAEIRAALPVLFAHAVETHGGIFSVILDGVADLALSVNDEAEAKVIYTELRALSISFDCPIVCVIHSNEAVKAGDDARGHLGKELTRKAESNLLLKKVGDVTVITSEKQRKAPITEEDGVAFRWSDAEQRHITCQSGKNAKDEAKREKSRDLAQAVFEHLDKRTARYSEIVKAIGDVRKIGASAAEDRFTDMKKLGVITKDLMNTWAITP